MYKLPAFVLLWILFIAIKLPTAILGLLVTPLLYRYRSTAYVRLPLWSRPWANPEDWLGGPNHYVDSLPRWWVESKGNTFKMWYLYHAIRNPANGLRSYELLDLTIVPEKVRFIRSKNFTEYRYDLPAIRAALGLGKTVWYFAWQGLQAGFKIVHVWEDDVLGTPRHMDIKFGWRVEPSDATNLTNNLGMRDASFASKFLFYRRG